MSSYLVTGGAGFIGSHIVDELVQRGETVRVLDDLSTGRRENIRHNLAHITLIEGDVRDHATVQQAVAGVDYVLHLAAMASVPQSVADPLTCNAVNVTGTLNLLTAARDAGARRVVYSSSSAVYGDNPILPKQETMFPEPLSPYAVSKLAGEYYCRAFSQIHGLPTVCLRYFNVFGPRQNPASQYAAAIPNFITRMLQGQSPIVYGDGLQSRDFIYVANVVAANLLACHSAAAVGQVLNVASGVSVTLLDLIGELNRILGTEIQPHFDKPRPGDVKHSQADTTQLKQLLGFDQRLDFSQGLRESIAWYQTTQ